MALGYPCLKPLTSDSDWGGNGETWNSVMIGTNVVSTLDGLTQEPKIHISLVVRYPRLDVTLPVAKRVGPCK